MRQFVMVCVIFAMGAAAAYAGTGWGEVVTQSTRENETVLNGSKFTNNSQALDYLIIRDSWGSYASLITILSANDLTSYNPTAGYLKNQAGFTASNLIVSSDQSRTFTDIRPVMDQTGCTFNVEAHVWGFDAMQVHPYAEWTVGTATCDATLQNTSYLGFRSTANNVSPVDGSGNWARGDFDGTQVSLRYVKSSGSNPSVVSHSFTAPTVSGQPTSVAGTMWTSGSAMANHANDYQGVYTSGLYNESNILWFVQLYENGDTSSGTFTVYNQQDVQQDPYVSIATSANMDLDVQIIASSKIEFRTDVDSIVDK